MSFLIEKVKSDTESIHGEAFDHAVITVPTNFNSYQRSATKQAGKSAGFESVRVISSTSATAMGHYFNNDSDRTVLIGDFGGGTLDSSVLNVGGGVYEVLSTAGDNELGGNDLDWKIVEWLLNQIQRDQNADLRNDRRAIQQLKKTAENAKLALSGGQKSASIKIPSFTSSDIGTTEIGTKISTQTFERLTRSLLLQAMTPIADTLERSGYSSNDIDEILLVGGSSKMPQVQQTVSELFATPLADDEAKDDSTALGVAIIAGVLSGMVDDTVLLDTTPMSVGVETSQGLLQPLVSRDTTIPTEESVVFTTAQNRQSSAEIRVYQGEQELARANHLLKKVILSDIQPMEAGAVPIEVTLNIDEYAEIQLDVVELHSGSDEQFTLTESSNYTGNRIVHSAPAVPLFATSERPQIGPAMSNEDNRVDRSATVGPTLTESDQILNTDLIDKVLSVRNNLNRAIQQEVENSTRSGVEATLEQLDHALKSEGLNFISPTIGTKMDPHRHQAIQQVDSDYSSGVITSVDQIGYETERYVLQPAKVSVSR